MRLLTLTLLTFCSFQLFAQQNLDNLKMLTTYDWEATGPASGYKNMPILEISFNSGYTKIDTGAYKGWYYGSEGVMSHRIVKNVRESYTIFNYLVKGDSLTLFVTMQSTDTGDQPSIYKLKYSIDTKAKGLTLLLPEKQKVVMKGTERKE